MNICLFSSEEISLPLSTKDERGNHLIKILHKKEGDTFSAGIIGNQAGTATITATVSDTANYTYPTKTAEFTLTVNANTNGTVEVAEEVKDYADSIINILDSVYNPALLAPEDTRKNNVTLSLNNKQVASKEFKELWSRINHKTVYAVDFDTDELIKKCIVALDTHLKVAKVTYTIKSGSMEEIQSKEKLADGYSFVMDSHSTENAQMSINNSVKYDLIGKLVEETNLTRKTIVGILKGILPSTFSQFKDNPEEFIIKAGNLINDQKATAVIEHITYNVLDETYDMKEIFADAQIKGKLDVNAIKKLALIFSISPLVKSRPNKPTRPPMPTIRIGSINLVKFSILSSNSLSI